MKVLTDYNQLVGKTISFSHMAQFANQITLATTDGEVLMATFEGYEDEMKIRVFNQWNVLGVLQRHEYLRNELDKLGIFNLEEWKKEQEEKQRKDRELSLKLQEEREKKEYERLKAKFENADEVKP